MSSDRGQAHRTTAANRTTWHNATVCPLFLPGLTCLLYFLVSLCLGGELADFFTPSEQSKCWTKPSARPRLKMRLRLRPSFLLCAESKRPGAGKAVIQREN